MVRNADATRARILDAAEVEFAERGFSGGRVDRIAAASGSNKRMIYVYFGDKAGLFTATLHQAVSRLIEAVPITEDDLPGYAVGLFDYLVEHPEALRLTSWRQLESPESGPEVSTLYAEKVAAMRTLREASGSGSTPIAPTDLLVLVQGMAGSWLNSPLDLLLADDADPMSAPRLAAHRAALHEAVARIVGP